VGLRKLVGVGRQWIEGVGIGNPRDDEPKEWGESEGGPEEDVELKLVSEYRRETE